MFDGGFAFHSNLKKSGTVRRLSRYSFNVELDSMKMFPLSDVSIGNASEIYVRSIGTCFLDFITSCHIFHTIFKLCTE